MVSDIVVYDYHAAALPCMLLHPCLSLYGADEISGYMLERVIATCESVCVGSVMTVI